MTAISKHLRRTAKLRLFVISVQAVRRARKAIAGTVGVWCAPLASMLSRKRECSQLMTEREFEEFWQNVDSRHRVLSPAKVLRRRAEEQARAEEVEPTLDDDDVAPPANPQSSAAARSAKAARCGSCDACRAKDCGECSSSWLRSLRFCVAAWAWVAPSRDPTALGCTSAWAGRTDTRLASAS